MKLTVRVVVHADDETETVVREAFILHRESLTSDTLGLRLAEAQNLLAAGAGRVGRRPGQHHAVRPSRVPGLRSPASSQGHWPLVIEALFGTLRPNSPRWWHCGCSPQAAHTVSPLAAILPERTTPELSSPGVHADTRDHVPEHPGTAPRAVRLGPLLGAQPARRRHPAPVIDGLTNPATGLVRGFVMPGGLPGYRVCAVERRCGLVARGSVAGRSRRRLGRARRALWRRAPGLRGR
ncbi:MAG: hypothetical protein ACRDRI_00025 [Pseudonocardiaceae bacterium]